MNHFNASRKFAALVFAMLGAGSARAAEMHPRRIAPPPGAALARLSDSSAARPQQGEGSKRIAPFKDASLPKLPSVTCGVAGVPVQSPPLSTGVTVTGDTTGGTSALNDYAQGGFPYNEDWGGQELVYSFTTASTGDIRAFIQPNPGVDVDVFILSACDTDQTLSVGDYAAVALAQPAGTYYIVVDTFGGVKPGPYSYAPGVFKLTVANAAGLLLVDDDGSGDVAQCAGGCPDVGTRYSAALTAAAIPYTTYNVAASGPLTLANLVSRKSVIWFTGGSYEPGVTLTAADQTNIRLFQNLGGRILLTGQDLLFDIMNGLDGRLPDSSLMQGAFQVASAIHDIDTLPANGCPTNAGQTGTFAISGTITDQSANTISGARLCFTGPARGSVSSIAGGTYSIPNLPAGTYTYWVDLRTAVSPTQLQSTLSAGNSTGRNFVIQAQPWPPGRTLTGVNGNPVSSDINGTAQTLVLTTANPYTPYTDALTTRYGEPVFFTADHRPAGFLFDGQDFFNAPLPYSKAIFLAFSPENDSTAGRLQTLLTRAYNWLNSDFNYCALYDATSNPTGTDISESLFSETGGTVNGYPDPGETVTYRITLTNHDTIGHTYRVGFAAQQPYVSPAPLWRTPALVAAGGSTTADFAVTVAASTAAAPTIRTGETLSRSYNLVFNDGTPAFCRGIGFGSFTGQASVMLVKDEGILPNTTGVDIYTTAFKNIGRTYALWDTAVFGHPPYGATAGYLPNEIMTPYSSVVWFTGFDFAGTLLPAFSGDRNAETDLAALLGATTGRLFLSSQDYLYDKYLGLSQDIPVTDFAYTQLKLQHVNQDYIKNTTDNVATESGVWATESAFNTMNQTYFSNFADGTQLRTGVTGASQLAHWTTGFPAGSVRKCIAGTDCSATSGPGLKMVFMPYAFENLADGGGASNKQRMLEKILCQFQTTTATGSPAGTPPCGYSPPAPVALQPVPAMMPQKLGPGSWQFQWPEQPVACNGDSIGGNWRVFGALDTPASQLFLRNAPIGAAGIQSVTPVSEAPAAGHTEFYSVPTLTDTFGTAPVASCP